MCDVFSTGASKNYLFAIQKNRSDSFLVFSEIINIFDQCGGGGGLLILGGRGNFHATCGSHTASLSLSSLFHSMVTATGVNMN